MNLLGCRVVRGPDWKWNDQDGGEGGVGTIVSTDTFSEGKPLNQQTVLVQWDNGRQADYRLGKDGNYDLRILDSAPSGVFFNDVMCGGCGQNPLLGTRWSCADCDEYDLCTNCYNNDMHDVDHNFMRFDHCNLQSIDVGKRSSSVKIQAKGIFPGSEVTSISGYDLGSMVGSVIMDHRMSNDIPVGKVLVEWGDEPNSSTKIEHNVGYHGEVHLKLESYVPGIYYYKDHLLNPSIALDTDKKFQVKDKVTVHLDVNDLHQIMTSYDHWEPEMERAISEVGVVEKVDGTGIAVKFKTLEKALVFPLYVFSKVHDLRVKDKVAVSDNKEKVIMLQNGHGGWNTNMEKCLGKKGVVLKIDKYNDASVKVGEDTWWFNSAALILESKEEERVSPDTVMTDSAEELLGNVLKAKEFLSKKAEGCKSFFQKNMPTITVIVNEGKDHKEIAKEPMDNSQGDAVTKKDESQVEPENVPRQIYNEKDSDDEQGNQITVIVPFGTEERLLTLSAEEVAQQLPIYLNVSRVDQQDPPPHVMKQCRIFCRTLKKLGRQDVVEALREALPAGMTGPLSDGNTLVRDMESDRKTILTRHLSVTEKWKPLAQELGATGVDIKYYEDKTQNHSMAVLKEYGAHLTVNQLYKLLVRIGANAVADHL